MCPGWSSPQIATSVDQKRTLAARANSRYVVSTTIGVPTSSCGGKSESNFALSPALASDAEETSFL